MKRYIRYTIIVIVIGISTTRNRIIRAAYDACTFNRNILTYGTPFCSTVSPSPMIGRRLSSSKMVSIFGRTASNPMLHIDSADTRSFACFIFLVSVCSTRIFRIDINTECRRVINTNGTCSTSNRNQHNGHKSNRDKFFHKMYLLRFFFRSFSLCYLLSCGILLTILAKHTAFQWRVPPLALFAGIIFHIHVSRSPLESRPFST